MHGYDGQFSSEVFSVRIVMSRVMALIDWKGIYVLQYMFLVFGSYPVRSIVMFASSVRFGCYQPLACLGQDTIQATFRCVEAMRTQKGASAHTDFRAIMASHKIVVRLLPTGVFFAFCVTPFGRGSSHLPKEISILLISISYGPEAFEDVLLVNVS